jgi:hypothetical protein
MYVDHSSFIKVSFEAHVGFFSFTILENSGNCFCKNIPFGIYLTYVGRRYGKIWLFVLFTYAECIATGISLLPASSLQL